MDICSNLIEIIRYKEKEFININTKSSFFTYMQLVVKDVLKNLAKNFGQTWQANFFVASKLNLYVQIIKLDFLGLECRSGECYNTLTISLNDDN